MLVVEFQKKFLPIKMNTSWLQRKGPYLLGTSLA